VEACLVDFFAAVLAIPSQPVNCRFRAPLFEHDADRIGKPNRIVWCVGREVEHITLVDVNISEFTVIYSFEEHSAFVLIEPFRRFVDMVIGPFVRPTNNLHGDLDIIRETVRQAAQIYHYCVCIIINAIIVYWWLEKMSVFIEPAIISTEYHRSPFGKV
jgi:hypothetical protein